MIVKEVGWDSATKNELKDILIADLFDSIGQSLKNTIRKGTNVSDNELIKDKVRDDVDNYFYRLVASDSKFSMFFPRLKRCNKFYIFDIIALPTGGIILTFTALFDGSVEPVILNLIY